jgi:hypothetical protein
MSRDDWVMFIPANGDGSRVAERGPKHSIILPEGVDAMGKVAGMAPRHVQIEIAVRQTLDYGSFAVPIPDNATVYFMDETLGQANTIYEWMQRARQRNYVLISNCDNWIDPDSIKLGMRLIEDNRAVCVVPTFRPINAKDTRFSYTRPRSVADRRLEVVEHKPVSDQAVAGVYMLRWDVLAAALWPDDVYLSQALSRTDAIYAFQVEQYMGWGDMDQLNEIEQGLPQYRVEQQGRYNQE